MAMSPSPPPQTGDAASASDHRARPEHLSVGIVIPFYQREVGILRRALETVKQQTYPGEILIAIVDDGSPSPAAAEVEGFAWPAERLLLIRQKNAGPAAARNRAMEALPATIDVIAFLDSDDEWEPEHLERACAAITNGADFYFADFARSDWSDSAFVRAGFPDAEHRAAANSGEGGALQISLLKALIKFSGFVQTSTVALRRSIAAGLGFPEERKRSFEDLLFWSQVSARCRKVAYATARDVTCGKGVNIFASVRWGELAYLDQLYDEVFVLREILATQHVDEEAAGTIKLRLRARYRELVKALAHFARRGQLDRRRIAHAARLAPALVPAALAVLSAGVTGKQNG
jgi:succinoglycan biosynthesis protein ExoW